MKLGVLSDVHDNIVKLRTALKELHARKIDTLIFCGDFCSPIAAKEMVLFDGTIHAVFGNGDGDPFSIAAVAAQHPRFHVHGQHAEVSIGHCKLAVTHYPLYGRALARTRDYSAVFSGHTHEVHQEVFDGCLWLNPGEVMGWKGQSTCAVYDTTNGSASILEL